MELLYNAIRKLYLRTNCESDFTHFPPSWDPLDLRVLGNQIGRIGQRVDATAINILHLHKATHFHQNVKLGQQALQDMSHTMLAGNAETPHPKAADEDKLGTDSERLESVGGRSDSGIEHDLVQIWLAAVRCLRGDGGGCILRKSCLQQHRQSAQERQERRYLRRLVGQRGLIQQCRRCH